MNGNGHTTLEQVKALIETILEGVVDLDGFTTYTWLNEQGFPLMK